MRDEIEQWMDSRLAFGWFLELDKVFSISY